MSLRGKDFRCELDPDLHEKLRVMAAFDDREVSRLGARLLENAIAAGTRRKFAEGAEAMTRYSVVFPIIILALLWWGAAFLAVLS